VSDAAVTPNNRFLFEVVDQASKLPVFRQRDALTWFHLLGNFLEERVRAIVEFFRTRNGFHLPADEEGQFGVLFDLNFRSGR
jgi:hypothetical protein